MLPYYEPRYELEMEVTSGLPVTREQAGSLNTATCIAILPEVPHLEQQAIPRAAISN